MARNLDHGSSEDREAARGHHRWRADLAEDISPFRLIDEAWLQCCEDVDMRYAPARRLAPGKTLA